MSSKDKNPIGKIIPKDRAKQIIKRTVQEREDNLEYSQIRKSIDKKPFYGYVADNKEMSLAIDVVTGNGDRVGIEYHKINSLIKFDISWKISFQASEYQIEIEGRCLDNIYQYLLEHRLVWIAGSLNDMEEFPKGETVIDSITIVPISEMND